MRSTMRDDSVRRKPTRSASRQKQPLGNSQIRQDSLSPARAPLTRTPSPHDATSAAQAAIQPRNPASVPTTFAVQNARRTPSPTNDPSLPIYESMRNRLAKTPYSQSSDYDPEHGIPLSDLNAGPSGSDSYRSTAPWTPRTKGQKRHKLAGKVKDGLLSAVSCYTDVWKARNEHVSDEHLGLRAVLDYLQQRKERKRIEWPTTPTKIHRGRTLTPKSETAWPVSQGVPMDRAPTPPQPAYASGRDRAPSVWTEKTGASRMTTWGNIINAVNRGDSAPEAPAPHPFAGAFVDDGKGKGKGKTRNKADLSVQTNDLPYSRWRPKPTIAHRSDSPSADPDLAAYQDGKRTWNRDQHAFDPSRESYTSADAARRYRAHTAASSIYSQPEAEHKPEFVMPPIPSKYTTHAITTTDTRPVSPLTVNTSISAFLSPRHTNRRLAGDWTDSFHGSTSTNPKWEDGRVSPILTEPAVKARPAPAEPRYGDAIDAQYDQNSVRGTQFYDFYRDSGIVFRGGR